MLDTAQEDSWDADITRRERLFCLHYCTDDETFLNATASYKKAYTKIDRATGKPVKLSNEVCESCSSRLMKKDRVRTAISRLFKLTQADLDEQNSYRLLHDVVIYATYNPADIIKEDGSLKVKKLSDLGELAKCVTDVIPGKYGIHFKLADRGKYISQLLQYLNIIRPEIKVDAQLPVIEMVQKAIDPESWNSFAEKNE